MFGIHVQYNGVFGLELAKRTVAFIGFDDEEGNLPLSRPSAFAKATADRPGTLSSADGGEGWGEGAHRSAVVSSGFIGKKRRVRSEPRVAFKLRHERADGVARPGRQLFQREAEEGAGGGFAVHARHADGALPLR